LDVEAAVADLDPDDVVGRPRGVRPESRTTGSKLAKKSTRKVLRTPRHSLIPRAGDQWSGLPELAALCAAMHDRPQFAVHVRGLQSCCPVVAVCGEVDTATAPELSEALASVLVYDPLHLVVDLANTTFFDCSGVRLLVSAKNHMSEESKVIVRRPPPTFQEALRILEIDPHGVVVIDAPTRPATEALAEFAVRSWSRRRFRTPIVPGPLSDPAPWSPGPAPISTSPDSPAPGLL
jgi:anti-sigma B factor antagonist